MGKSFLKLFSFATILDFLLAQENISFIVNLLLDRVDARIRNPASAEAQRLIGPLTAVILRLQTMLDRLLNAKGGVLP